MGRRLLRTHFRCESHMANPPYPSRGSHRQTTLWRGYSGLKTPLRSTQKFLRRDVDGGGGGATRPSAALAPSAPAAYRLLMRCSRAARSMSRASARSQRCCGLRPQRPLAARPSAALAPSAPAGTCIGMRLSRAGQSHLARLLARKPWTPRAFRAKSIKSTGTPHFAPSAKFQLILQVFPTEVCKGFASKCPGGQIELYRQTDRHINGGATAG